MDRRWKRKDPSRVSPVANTPLRRCREPGTKVKVLSFGSHDPESREVENLIIIIIIIIIMGLKSVSASEDVIGDLPSPGATINSL